MPNALQTNVKLSQFGLSRDAPFLRDRRERYYLPVPCSVPALWNKVDEFWDFIEIKIWERGSGDDFVCASGATAG